MQLVYTSADNATIQATLDAGETLGHVSGPGVVFVPTDPANAQYQAIQESGQPILPYVPSRAGVIAQSSQALSLSQAQQLNAQGRTQEAVAAILTMLEQRT